jgi:valyl-tRNA synthetase
MKLPKVYEPGEYEQDIYALWEKSGVFEAHPEKHADRFSVAMPPPNETGSLSIGHSLFCSWESRHNAGANAGYGCQR